MLLVAALFLTATIANATSQSKVMDAKCLDVISADRQKLKAVVNRYKHLQGAQVTQWLRWGRELVTGYATTSKSKTLTSCQSMTNQQLAAMQKRTNTLVLNIVCSVKHKMHYMEQCQNGKPGPSP